MCPLIRGSDNQDNHQNKLYRNGELFYMTKQKVPAGPLELASDTESVYTVEGRKYIVTTVFKENAPETFGDILMKLIQAEALPDH